MANVTRTDAFAQDIRGGGRGYWSRREKQWRKAGITFRGKPLTGGVFILLLDFQGHKCAVCRMKDAFENLAADHVHKGPRKGELRGATCHHCNQRVIGIVEKYGHFRNERVTLAARRYLARPPAWTRKFNDYYDMMAMRAPALVAVRLQEKP